MKIYDVYDYDRMTGYVSNRRLYGRHYRKHNRLNTPPRPSAHRRGKYRQARQEKRNRLEVN